MAAEAIVGYLRALLTLDSAEFESGIRKSSAAAKTFQKDLKSFGRDATELGTALTKTVTLPIAGLGLGIAKLAIDFESSFAGIRKTVGAATDSLGNLTETGRNLAAGMRSLSREIPVNVNELNKIGEAAGQLGIRAESIVGFTKVMAELGVATNLSGDQAATSLARLANITGMQQDKFDRLGSVIVDLGNNFATTEAEVVEFGLRIAGAGAQAKMSEADILAIGAAMSSVGVEAEAGGTAVQKVILQMLQATVRGGDDLKNFAKTAGMSSAEFKRAFEQDAAGAFTTFVEGLGRQGKNAIKTLSDLGLEDQRLIRSFLSLSGAGDLLRNSLELGNKAWEANTALSKEAGQRFATTEQQLKLLWNRLADVGITLGNALLPALQAGVRAAEALVPVIAQLAQAFADMPPVLQMTVFGLAGMAAIAGPVIWGLGQLALSGSAIVGAFTKAGLATQAFRTALVAGEGISGALAAATGATGLLSIGLAGLSAVAILGGLWLLYTRIRDVGKAAEDAASGIDRIGKPLKNAVDGFGNALVTVDEVEAKLKLLPGALATVGSAGRKLTVVTDETGKSVDGLGSSAGKTGSALGTMGSDTDKLTAAQKRLKAALEGIQAAQRPLNEIQKAAINGLVRLGQSHDEIATLLGVHCSQVSVYLEQQKKWEKGLGAAYAATVPLNAVQEAAINGLKRLGLSNEEAADALGLHVAQVNKYTAGIDAAKTRNAALVDEWREMQALMQQGVPDLERAFPTPKGSRPEDAWMYEPWLQSEHQMFEPGVERKQASSLLAGFGNTIRTQLGPTIVQAFAGGGNVGSAVGSLLGGSIASSLAGTFKDGVFTSGAGKFLQDHLGKTLGGAIGSAIPFVGALAGPLLGKMFSKILGGPSQRELEGRKAAGDFRTGILQGLSEGQMAEVQSAAAGAWRGNEAGAATVIALRDAYIRMGKSASEAQALAVSGSERLHAAEKQGAAAVQAVQRELSVVFAQVEQSQKNAAKFAEGFPQLLKGIADSGAVATREFKDLLASIEATGEFKGEIDSFIAGQAARGASGLNSYLQTAVAGYATLEENEKTLAGLLEQRGEKGLDYERRRRDLLQQIDELGKKEKRSDEDDDRLGDLRDDLEKLDADFKKAGGSLEEQIAKVRRGITDATSVIKLNQIATQEAATAMGAALFASFAELQKRGVGVTDALKAVAPGVKALEAQLLKTGFNGGAAFRELATMASLASDTVKGPTLGSVHSLAEALVGLSNANLLTQDLFVGLTNQITTSYNAMQLQGVEGAAALRLIAPDLQKIWELQQDYGYAVDGATQKLIDQGIQAGLVGDKHRDANDRIALSLQALVTLMGDFIKSLQASKTDADATKGAVEGIGTAAANLPDAEFTITERRQVIVSTVEELTTEDIANLPPPPGYHWGGEGWVPDEYHRGGFVTAHQGMYLGAGLRTGEVMIKALQGEAVLNRPTTAALGGRSGIDEMNDGNWGAALERLSGLAGMGEVPASGDAYQALAVPSNASRGIELAPMLERLGAIEMVLQRGFRRLPNDIVGATRAQG